jgi:hypothetical protein
VEAIRRLLNKDACIGADLTMVNDIIFVVLCPSLVLFHSQLVRICQRLLN